MDIRRTVGRMAAQGTLFVCLLLPGLAFAANTPSSPAPTATQPAAQTQTNQSVGGFVPLTHLPQIQALSQPTGFATFVNTFYKILIGVGAVLAVLMIMYAGVQFMTSRGSVTGNEKAKSRIQNAIFGLILVLAPTIVFSIINPDILHLNLGTEFGGLKESAIQQGAFDSPLQAQQCSSIKQKAAVPLASGQSSASACSKKGAGWASYDDACCSVTDPTHYTCCGYDPANAGTPSAPTTPEGGSGTFTYDYVVQDKNLDTGAACTTGVQTRHFTTQSTCSADAAKGNSANVAIRSNCTSTETYTPSQQRFNQINALPTCPP